MPEIINSGQIIKRPEIVLDPAFPLPPGIIDVRLKTQAEIGLPSENDAGANFDESEEEVNVIIDLPSPQSIKIISRTTRVLADNSVVVDVVIETPDIRGVTEFETRITKL